MVPANGGRGSRSGSGRREFLRTVATSGYAIGVATFLGVEDFLGAGSGDVSIVTALVRSDPDDPWSIEQRTKRVPADWYAAVTKAFEINDLLARTGVTGYLGSAVVPGEYRNPGASITVDVSVRDFDQTVDLIESLVNEVSFHVNAVAQGTASSSDREGRPFRHLSHVEDGRIPGGVTCQVETSRATLTPTLYDPSTSQTLFATASHTFEGPSPARGELSLLFENGQKAPLGHVKADHTVEDVVTVAPNGTFRPDSAIDGFPMKRVRGQFTRMGLADLAARGKSLEKVGARTGRTTGRIEGIDAITCLTGDTCRHGQLRWGDERDMADGDSGSVSYRWDSDAQDGGVLVAGFNNARTWWPGQNYIWGTAAYLLTERYGYHF
ncbi:hypothetical protein [Natrinema gelatinilyticum]|uniref:hypothetical protein n=1 Tax=Natrinema gelatinilyticum TaxID=2961571 RepID=UPI0020C1ED86|nr:hypothetical protein [Natrinema gelatinilyticum]